MMKRLKSERVIPWSSGEAQPGAHERNIVEALESRRYPPCPPLPRLLSSPRQARRTWTGKPYAGMSAVGRSSIVAGASRPAGLRAGLTGAARLAQWRVEFFWIRRALANDWATLFVEAAVICVSRTPRPPDRDISARTRLGGSGEARTANP